jgi:DNA primase
VLPPGFIADLLSRVDVVEVVGRHVELKKGGANLMGLCPFHGEKSPSFSVSPSKQFYYCFGCGASGDALKFLTEFNGMPFMEAVRDLAQQVGLPMPESNATPEQEARADEERAHRTTLFALLERAGEHYRAQLKANPRAVGYLKKRGLTGAIAARFGLGYAAEGWRTLAGVFPRYDDPLLAECGLVISSGGEADGGGEEKRYDRFRDRIMFPIRSVKGELIGFGGRVLDTGEPKYLNSPETPVFHKGRELYGLFEARQGLRAKGYALVVEGYMDVVALAQWGYPNAVATLGTACTAEHVAKLLRFTDAVVFSFDGDAAGRRAAGRALEAALPHATDTRSIRFLFLPTEHDPDSFIRELGPEAFEAAVTQAVPLSAQLVVHASAECDLATAEGRARMLSQARPLVALLPDGLLREQLVNDLAQRGGLSVEALRAHWARGEPGRPGAAAADAPSERPRTERPRWGRPGRATPSAANQLDRAAWLLTRHADLWLGLSHDTQLLLCEQPPPHGPYFCAIERVLHDHGPLVMGALLQDLSADGQADSLRTLQERVLRFHDSDADPPASMLEAVLRNLELDAVNEELRELTGAGDLSATAAARLRVLYARQAELKRTVAAVP